MNDTQVLIVGAGPAGALIGLLLARRGIETCLIERQTDFEREFRGEVLMPGGLAMLEQAEIDLSTIPHRTPNQFIGYSNGRRFIDFTLDSTNGNRPRSVSQPALLSHLVELANQEPNFTLSTGETAKDLEWDATGLPVVRTRSDAGEQHWRARLVIGADGRASVVRKHGGFRVRDLGAPMDIVWGKIAWPDDWTTEQARVYLGGGHLLLTLPAPDGQLQVAWAILKGTFGDLRARGFDAWFDSMAEHVDPELAVHLQKHSGDVKRPFLLDVQTTRTEGWVKNNVLLIGDAAHTMSPVGAQGLNVAMRDAVVACNQLAPVLRAGGDVNSAAMQIEKIRGPEIDRIQTLAARPPRLVLGRSWAHQWMRQYAVRMLGTRLGQKLAARTAREFMYGTQTVRLDPK